MKAIPIALFNIAVLCSAPTAAAQQFGDFTYTNNNGTITITRYFGNSAVVAIPSAINNFPVTGIGRAAFLKSSPILVTIPSSVTSIGDGAFTACPRLAVIAIPNSVTNIGESAFSGCNDLVMVTMGNGVTGIGDSAFSGCTSLPGITIPGSVTSIGDSAFSDCTSLPGITIPGSVTSIGDHAFSGCANLTLVTMDNGVTNIGGEAFSRCTNLTSITIPESVTNVGALAFSGCSSLTGITISNGVTSIGSDAFVGTSLTNITIPGSVTNIWGGAFEGCVSLRQITVDALNPVYSSVDGVLFDKGQSMLIQYPLGKVGSYTIPNGVTSIGADAFASNTGLINVTIPYGVTSIGIGTFYSCSSLTSITIPNSVTNLGGAAFYGCSNLTYVTIGNGVTAIGQGTFDFCGHLAAVYFKGNAPSAPSSIYTVFEADNRVTVYYLPGTTGWGRTFAHAATALWEPRVQTGVASFGLWANQFGFSIEWAGGMSVVVEATTNLANPTWYPLATNILTSDSFYFSDPQWTNYPTRFYRVRSP